MAVVITLSNQKGGVAKTSCCHHLAGAFASMGLRSLLLDNDPQSSLSQGFWGPAAVRSLQPSETIAALYAGETPYPAAIIRPTGVDGIDLLPGSRAAMEYNIPYPYRGDPEQQLCLKTFVDEVRDAYDVILLDNPPNLHMATWASMIAADHLILPLKPEDYSAQGIIDVRESVEMVQAGMNPGLRTLGYLLTLVAPRKTVHKLYMENLALQFPDLVLANRMDEAVTFVEALNQRLPVVQYKPKSAAAKAMVALAGEVLSRARASAEPRLEAVA